MSSMRNWELGSRMRGPKNELDGWLGFILQEEVNQAAMNWTDFACSTVVNVIIPQNCSHSSSHDLRAFKLKALPLSRNHALEKQFHLRMHKIILDVAVP